MKRLLKIGLDQVLLSFMPIFSWFMLSLIVDKNLINVFTLTYPIQFIWLMLKSVFGTGANICKEKDKNKNAVLSGITLGMIIGAVIFGIVLFNIEEYISFMNMDLGLYKEFAVYSVIQLYTQLILALILEKLYYENKNTLANKYSITFNLLNFFTLILSALVFKDKWYIVIMTLVIIIIYTVIITVKSYEKFKLKCNIFRFIKYNSVDFFSNVAFFIIFLFGLSNATDYGTNYTIALTFVALITDTQWDVLDAISTVAKIDISKNQFNYIKHRNNAYTLLILLLISTFTMFILLFKSYDLNLKITLIYLGFEIINFLIYPIYGIKTCFLQLEYSSIKTTSNKMFASGTRMLFSFWKNPFCTGIGQVFSSFYQFISINILFNKNYFINKDGIIREKLNRVINKEEVYK